MRRLIVWSLVVIVLVLPLAFLAIACIVFEDQPKVVRPAELSVRADRARESAFSNRTILATRRPERYERSRLPAKTSISRSTTCSRSTAAARRLTLSDRRDRVLVQHQGSRAADCGATSTSRRSRTDEHAARRSIDCRSGQCRCPASLPTGCSRLALDRLNETDGARPRPIR